MNKVLIQLDKAIAIMRRANNLNMKEYQMSSLGKHLRYNEICTSENSLHRCGNTACFAGYVAISTEFKNDDG